MPAFLTPYPPTLSPASESQAFSGSSLSSNSNASSSYFDRVSRQSSGSAYLTDLTPPSITPSHTNYDKEHGKAPQDDSISHDPLIGPFKRLFESRILRAPKAADIDDEAGYTTDCELENTPLLDAVGAVHARLKSAEPTVNTQRALKIMEQHTNAAPNDPELLDEPLLAPSMPAMKVVVTKAEETIEDWSSEFVMGNSNVMDAIPSPVSHNAGLTTIPNIPFPPTKDQLWQHYADNEFEKAFHEGVAEDAGRSFFPDEIKLFPANTFAFGTAGISGWREEPSPVVDKDALSPPLPKTPVLRPLDESDWEASSLALNSPSLVFDSSVSISQMLISPQQLDNASFSSSPAILDISHINHNSPFNSPLMAISTLMFASRRPLPPVVDALTGVQNLDVPALMRLEIAATLAAQQQHPNEAAATGNHALAGLGLEISPSQLPESSFPSCNSLPSIYSLPSWDPNTVPTTSTPPPGASDTMDPDTTASSVAAASIDEQVSELKGTMDASITGTRRALSDIPEETSAAPSLNNAESSRQIVGLGFDGLAESTLQSSASITRLRSPEAFPITRSFGDLGFSSSMSLTDLLGPYHSLVDSVSHDSYSVIESSGIFEGLHLSMVSDHGSESFNSRISGVELSRILPDFALSRISGVEPSGVLPDVSFLEPWHYSPGVANWLLLCSEVGPAVPLEDAVVISGSPAASFPNMELSCGWNSEIVPSGVLSGMPTACSIDRKSMSAILAASEPQDVRPAPHTAGAPRLRRQSQLRQSVVASDLEGGVDPRSPVLSARPAVDAHGSLDLIVETSRIALPDSASRGSCVSSAERRSLKPSKSAEGLGMGLPSDRASIPPRQREATASGVDTASMMSTAEECLDLSRLAASPTSSAGSPTMMVSEERGGARFFFKMPRFAKRSLYPITEAASPPASSAASSPRAGAVSPRGRSLSAAWSDLTNRLRSPGKSSGTPRFPAAPLSSSPLAGPSGDARCATAAPTLPPLSSSPDTLCLPQPPQLVPRQPRASWFARLSGSRGSSSPPTLSPATKEEARSPGMTEHVDAPRNTLGMFRRSRFARSLQMLF